MIKIHKGNIFDGKEQIIAHQTNCIGGFGAGFARQIRDRFPKVYTEYSELVAEHTKGEDLRRDLLGRVQGVSLGHRKYIANMFGQYSYGKDGRQYTNTEALFNCFKTVRIVAEKSELTIAMPYGVGCGLAGGNWEEVEGLLLTAFDGYEVTLYKL